MTAVGGAPRGRRKRSVTESLGSIVLGFEVIIVFLASLAIGGLGRLPWGLALGLGIGLCVLIIIAIGLLRYPVGVWLGWAAQALFVAGGLLVGEIFIAGALFAAIWTYCMIVGGRLDGQPPRASTT